MFGLFVKILQKKFVESPELFLILPLTGFIQLWGVTNDAFSLGGCPVYPPDLPFDSRSAGPFQLFQQKKEAMKFPALNLKCFRVLRDTQIT